MEDTRLQHLNGDMVLKQRARMPTLTLRRWPRRKDATDRKR